MRSTFGSSGKMGRENQIGSIYRSLTWTEKLSPVEMASIPYPNMKTTIHKLKKTLTTGSQMRFYNSRAVPSPSKPYELILIQDPAAADHLNSRE